MSIYLVACDFVKTESNYKVWLLFNLSKIQLRQCELWGWPPTPFWKKFTYFFLRLHLAVFPATMSAQIYSVLFSLIRLQQWGGFSSNTTLANEDKYKKLLLVTKLGRNLSLMFAHILFKNNLQILLSAFLSKCIDLITRWAKKAPNGQQ